jgi:hypothetical protein
VGQAVDQARRKRELSKEALASNLGRLETRVRAELDWRTRLRRDGPRIAMLGGATVLVVGGLLLVRKRLRHRDDGARARPATLEDLAAELEEIRRTLEKHNGKGESVAQKALLRALSAAGSAGGTYVAKRMMARESAAAEGTGPAGA